METKRIITITAIAIIAFIAGYVIGSWLTIKAVAEVASNFIEVDEELVSQAIFQYRNNIGSCYGKTILQNITA